MLRAPHCNLDSSCTQSWWGRQCRGRRTLSPFPPKGASCPSPSIPLCRRRRDCPVRQTLHPLAAGRQQHRLRKKTIFNNQFSSREKIQNTNFVFWPLQGFKRRQERLIATTSAHLEPGVCEVVDAGPHRTPQKAQVVRGGSPRGLA
jgi:hypothetical protein